MRTLIAQGRDTVGGAVDREFMPGNADANWVAAQIATADNGVPVVNHAHRGLHTREAAPRTGETMFEHRLMIAQGVLAIAGLFVLIAMICFMTGSLVGGVIFLVLEHVVAALGCAILADARGYPAVLGIPIGIGLGVMGSVLLMILPDESPDDDDMARKIKLASEGVKNARQRDPGYEVLDDDD
jgi:hypothetical protein